MEFDKDVGRLQRLMAASIAGVNRRQAIRDPFNKSWRQNHRRWLGVGQLLGHLAKGVGKHGEVIVGLKATSCPSQINRRLPKHHIVNG